MLRKSAAISPTSRIGQFVSGDGLLWRLPRNTTPAGRLCAISFNVMLVAAEATVEGESEFFGVMYDELMRGRWATQVERHETLDIE